MSDRKCSCTLAQKLVGDGCEVCNPAYSLEMAKAQISDLEAKNRELRGLLLSIRDAAKWDANSDGGLVAKIDYALKEEA